MTATLEKAVLSVAAALTDGPVSAGFSLDDVNGWTVDKAQEIVRAVLMAVREPSEAVAMAAVNIEDQIVGTFGFVEPEGAFNEGGPQLCFTAMIDAILNEQDQPK